MYTHACTFVGANQMEMKMKTKTLLFYGLVCLLLVSSLIGCASTRIQSTPVASPSHESIASAPIPVAGNELPALVPLTHITYQGKQLELSGNVLYVNENLTDAEMGAYTFRTLQAAIAAAPSGTRGNPVVIYLEPNVYWTDDYTAAGDRGKDDLIGLAIPQEYISLVGITGNRDDVVIASDRGQNAGANGNFNTLGISTGFHAKDITLGNYCNIDLVYERDPSKSHAKRQEAVTQAQVITKVPGVEVMDEWFFENCNIVSRLNLFSRDERPFRTLIKDSHLECTDDSLGTGYITIFENCDIYLFSNTPTGGASHYMQAYLNTTFTTTLSDDKVITFSKNDKPFAFIDSAFLGDVMAVEWKQGQLPADMRQVVSHITINGQPLTISAARPDISYEADAVVLQAFKVGDVYNVYNLLNGAGYSEWDPLNQKDSLEAYAGAWNIQFDYNGKAKDVRPVLKGDGSDKLQVIARVLGGKDDSVQWSVSDNALVLDVQEDGSVVVSAASQGFVDHTVLLEATAANGLKKALAVVVTPATIAAPTLREVPTLSVPSQGAVHLDYKLSRDLEEGLLDRSVITWYRGASKDGSDKVPVARSSYVRGDELPYTSYPLTLADAGFYIFADVTPQLNYSGMGETVAGVVPARFIRVSDVNRDVYHARSIDVAHLVYQDANELSPDHSWDFEMQNGLWYGGFFLPAEYNDNGIYADKKFAYVEDEAPYTYAAGQSGAAGTFGLQTTTQGARLVYQDNRPRMAMKMVVDMSPHKTAAQGFGSAKQFMDIYFMYDAQSQTGYGLRIARVPSIEDEILKSFAAKSCSFTLMHYQSGIATPVSETVVSTAFLPDCTVVLELKDGSIVADVTTASVQDSAYPAEMAHEVHLQTLVGEGAFPSGFGFQHTGTAGAGKSGNRTTIHSIELEY